MTEPKHDPRDPAQVAAHGYIELHSLLPEKRDELPVKRDELAMAVVVDTIHKIRREQLSQWHKPTRNVLFWGQRWLESYRCPGHVIATLYNGQVSIAPTNGSS